MIFKQMFSALGLIPGQQQWTTAGTYSFIVPANCYSIAAVTIGGGGGGANTGADWSYFGGGGGGGGLAYNNAIPVTPGETLTIIVGDGGLGAPIDKSDGYPGDASSIKRSASFLLNANGGAKGEFNAGLGKGGVGGSGGGIAGTVAYTGGTGATGSSGSVANGGFSGKYTSNGSNGSTGNSTQSAPNSANLTGGYGTFGTGSAGANSSSPRAKGNTGGVRIMWGAGRSFPSNAADV